jgi:hypothetical protein
VQEADVAVIAVAKEVAGGFRDTQRILECSLQEFFVLLITFVIFCLATVVHRVTDPLVVIQIDVVGRVQVHHVCSYLSHELLHVVSVSRIAAEEPMISKG